LSGKKHIHHLSAQVARAFTFSFILMYYFYGIHDLLRACYRKNKNFAFSKCSAQTCLQQCQT